MAKNKTTEAVADLPVDQQQEANHLPVLVTNTHDIEQLGASTPVWFGRPIRGENRVAWDCYVRTGQAIPMESVIDKWLEVSWFAAYGELLPAKDDGEMVELIAVILILEDGTKVKTNSIGVRRDMIRLLAANPATPWKPPVKVRPVKQRLANGHSMTVLETLPPVE